MKINIKLKIEIKAPCNEGSFVVFAVVSSACVFPCLLLLPSAMKLFMHTHIHTPHNTTQHNTTRQNTTQDNTSFVLVGYALLNVLYSHGWGLQWEEKTTQRCKAGITGMQK